MKKTYGRVRIRLDDYIADSLEHEASIMPFGFEENAKILRQQVKFFREITRSEMLTIWKPVADN